MLENIVRLLFFPIVVIDLDEILPFFGYFFFREYGCDGAGRLAGAAVDALVGIDVELRGLCKTGFVLSRMDAINRANLNTCRVFDVYARFSDYIRHIVSVSFSFPAF
jgi:hypothetical protein